MTVPDALTIVLSWFIAKVIGESSYDWKSQPFKFLKEIVLDRFDLFVLWNVYKSTLFVVLWRFLKITVILQLSMGTHYKRSNPDLHHG